MDAVALLTCDSGPAVVVRVREVDGVLVGALDGSPVDLVSVVAVFGLEPLPA